MNLSPWLRRTVVTSCGVQGRVSASQALMPLSMLTSDAIRLIIDHL